MNEAVFETLEKFKDESQETKKTLYKLYSINTAINLLRPGADWESNGHAITKWKDSRPEPSWQEILYVMEKIKEFEESIPTIWREDQIKKFEMFDTRI